MNTVVIKVGGSLFDLPDFSARLSRFLTEIEGAQPLLICGGGEAANVVRRWDQRHHLGEETAHWLAIQALMLNDRLLCELLPGACIVSSQVEAAAAWRKRQIPILCSYTYLKETTETPIAPLPSSWDVTSDSIAAWVTVTWRADELVLLKSVDLPRQQTLAELSETQLIDQYFPNFSESLPLLRWCNLRSPEETPQLATVTKGNSFHIRNATGPA